MTKESREKISRAMRERWAKISAEERSVLLKDWMKKKVHEQETPLGSK